MKREQMVLEKFEIRFDRQLEDDCEFLWTEGGDSTTLVGIRGRMIKQVVAEWDESVAGARIPAILVPDTAVVLTDSGYSVSGSVYIDVTRLTQPAAAYLQETLYDVGGMAGSFTLTDLTDDELAAEQSA